MAETILVTGGAGYIGSHTSVELLDAGYEVVVVDNLVNSSVVAIDRIREITGKDLAFHEVDLTDAEGVEGVFQKHRFDAVVHFAALKAVGESTEIPLRYFANNLTGTLTLLEAMKRHGVRDFIFSSSCTVYGEPASVPVTEEFPLSAASPYGRTKLMIEEVLADVARYEKGWRIIPLRYFNPVGAHQSGRIGEDPRGIPNNIMPFVMQVAVGRLPKIRVFGDDYPTRDGTGVRDYIHVVDLSLGHLAALRALKNIEGCVPYNLGTGHGYTVLELIEAAGKAAGRELPYEIVERRPGDIAEIWADPARAERDLGWKAERGIEEMCADHWRWQSANPEGFSAS